jgi:PhzF family phenazine biosynthesis protein
MTKTPETMTFQEIRAFTQTGVKALGNPAMVTLVDEFPDDKAMGKMAKTLASPMTTFIKPTTAPGVYDLRHFSPDGGECHICGHATMAAAEFLAREKPELRKNGQITFKLNPKFGVSDKSEIIAVINGNDISMTMPAVTELQPITDPEFYKIISAGLKVAESEITKPAYFAPRTRDLVIAFHDQDVLLTLQPDFKALKEMALKGKYIHEGLMGTAKSTIAGYDIVNRVFLPGINVNEDIACGSANCSIIPFWALKTTGIFDPSQKDFRVLYPYPPGAKDEVGGVQQLHLEAAKKEIVLTGQALYAKTVALGLSKKKLAASNSNQHKAKKFKP